MKERREDVSADKGIFYVSIHAPMKERHLHDVFEAPFGVSIHAPMKERQYGSYFFVIPIFTL